MMYHTAHSQRYGRAKGMKVKHLVQLVVLTVLFTWFLYQLNSSHKAKVLSLRTEKEDDIDDELLISADSRDRNGVENDEISTGEVAQEEFIDRKSVLKSRKIGPPDVIELEQTIAEGDRMEDVLDDSGEGDRDDRANSDDHVRRAELTKVKKGSVEEDQKALLRTRATETAEDRGDGEDEVADTITGKELDGSEGKASTNFTESVEDDTLIYTSEDSKVKGVDVSEEKALMKSRETNGDDNPDEKKELAASESSENRKVLKAREDLKNFTKQDDGGIDHLGVSKETHTGNATLDVSLEKDADKNLQHSEMVTSASAALLAKPRSKLGMLHEDQSKESNITGKIISRSPHEFNEEIVGGTVPLQSGADGKAVQGLGAGYGHSVALSGDGLDNVALRGDGPDSVQQDLIINSLSEVKQGQPLQQETIVEVVSVLKEDEPVQQEAIAEVVSAAKQEKAVGQ